MQYPHKKIYKRLGGLLSVGLIIAGVFIPTAFAQTNQDSQAGFNFSTSPVVANLDTKPGSLTTTQIQIRNNGQTTEHVKASILRFTSNNSDGTPQMIEPDPKDEFLKWVTFSESNFDAEPNVWKKINVTISPPATAAFGYYYAVAFSRNSEAANKARVTNLTGSVAVPILLNVEAPGVVRKADITNFSVNKNVFEFLPSTFSATLKNSGNTHVAPRGNIFITKGGKNIDILEVNEGKGNILPNTSRKFTSDWSDGSPVYRLKKATDGTPILDEAHNPKHFLDWSKFDPSKVRFGKYHAKITMVYNDGQRDVPNEAQLDFWVIPWRILGSFVVVLLLLGLGLWTLIRPLRNRIKKQPAKTPTYKADV